MFVKIMGELVVRIPPNMLSSDYKSAVFDVGRDSLEGKLINITKDDKTVSKCYVIKLLSIEAVGEGTIVHGDGAVYQYVKYEALGFEPLMHEVIDGEVISVPKFGAFVKLGPFDGLLHISQIMDDRIDVDIGNQRIVGKDTKKDIKVGDKIRVRIVSLNLNSATLEDSRIGLTMKQTGLGKLEWLENARRESVGS